MADSLLFYAFHVIHGHGLFAKSGSMAVHSVTHGSSLGRDPILALIPLASLGAQKLVELLV